MCRPMERWAPVQTVYRKTKAIWSLNIGKDANSHSWKEKSKLKKTNKLKGKTPHTREMQAEVQIGATTDGG